MRYLSLFSGIGGFELGIQQAYESISNQELGKERQNEGALLGHNLSDACGKSNLGQHPTCIGFSEIDKYAVKIYQSHFPEHHNYGDITKLDPSTLPDFELLVGGFPCQAFSIAGKRKGFEDTRGTLFFEIARILREKRPRLLLLENVKGILSHDNGRTFKVIITTLDELGYDLQWQVLNSKDFGVPQNRERVFIVGHLRGTPRPEVFPFLQDGGEATQRGVHSGTLTTRYPASQREGTYIEEDGDKAGKIDQINSPVHSNDRIYGLDGISPTLNTMQGGNRQPKIGIDIANTVTPDAYLTRGERKRVDGKAVLTSMFERRIRRLTPIECERLQGFPDGWTAQGILGPMSDTRRYKSLGNAVTVNVIHAITERLI